MKKNDSNLFYTCSLIELIGRSTRQKRKDVVKLMGEKTIRHIYHHADTLHCEPIAKIADYYIDFCHIPTGEFDNIASCKYSVPSYWEIGKVYARLIEDIQKDDVIFALIRVYNSTVSDSISYYNSDFFYQPRGFIKEQFLSEENAVSGETSKKPAIRFRGFTDAWEQREFEKTFSLLQNNTLSRAELSASAGVAANIHYGDVLIKFGEYLDMRKETFPWIEKQTDADKFRTSFLQDGDVVFADTAEDETAGKCCEIRNCGSMVIISGLHTIPCRPESKFASGYLGYYLNSTAFHEQLVPLMQGTKVVSISKAALKSTFVRYPSDDKEQQKIGTFFRKFDDLLALHQRKHEKLGSIKKALLEKMFPKNGTKFPEIRFSGFTDAWEQRKLGGVAQVYDGIHQTPIYQDHGVMFLSVENILTMKSEKFISEEAFKRDYKVFPQKGDILMTRIGDVGTPNVVETIDKLAYYVSLALLKPLQIDSYFLCNSIQSPLFQAGLKERTLTTAIPQKINKEEIGKIVIIFPKATEEQQRIGLFFKSLDRLITLHQRELEKLRNIKKACLEKMFV